MLRICSWSWEVLYVGILLLDPLFRLRSISNAGPSEAEGMGGNGLSVEDAEEDTETGYLCDVLESASELRERCVLCHFLSDEDKGNGDGD